MSNAFAGLETVMEFGYGSGATVFKVVGRCTAKAISSTIDNIDATSDDSPGSIREYVETYIGQTINFAANAGKDVARSATVDELELFLYDPLTQSQTDRTLTVRLTRPVSAAVPTNRTYVMDVLPTSWNIDAPYDGLVTVTIDGNTTSAVVVTDTAV